MKNVHKSTFVSLIFVSCASIIIILSFGVVDDPAGCGSGYNESTGINEEFASDEEPEGSPGLEETIEGPPETADLPNDASEPAETAEPSQEPEQPKEDESPANNESSRHTHPPAMTHNPGYIFIIQYIQCCGSIYTRTDKVENFLLVNCFAAINSLNISIRI